MELADYEKTFLDQAAQVNSWDRLLMENGEKVKMIHIHCSSLSHKTIRQEMRLLQHCFKWVSLQDSKFRELYVTDCERDVSVSIMVKSAISHLHPNIGMQVLHTVLYTFPMEFARRSCLTIKSFLSFRTFPLFA